MSNANEKHENQVATELMSVLGDEALNAIAAGMDINSAVYAGSELTELLKKEGWSFEPNSSELEVTAFFSAGFKGMVPPASTKPKTS